MVVQSVVVVVELWTPNNTMVGKHHFYGEYSPKPLPSPHLRENKFHLFQGFLWHWLLPQTGGSNKYVIQTHHWDMSRQRMCELIQNMIDRNRWSITTPHSTGTSMSHYTQRQETAVRFDPLQVVAVFISKWLRIGPLDSVNLVIQHLARKQDENCLCTYLILLY